MNFVPTLKILTSSLIVSFSGGFKLLVVFLLLGAVPDFRVCAGFVLLIYSVYTLDRAVDSKEDTINKEEPNGNKPISFAIIITALISSAFLLKTTVSPYIVLVPLFIGILYSKGVQLGSFSIRLKRGRGVKNVVTAITWSITIALILYRSTRLPTLIIIVLYIFTKSLINTILFDYRDVEGDKKANIKTLPITLGFDATKTILLKIHLLIHLIILLAALKGTIAFETVIIFYSLIGGLAYIKLYSNNKGTPFRSLIIDGEWAFAFILNRAI